MVSGAAVTRSLGDLAPGASALRIQIVWEELARYPGRPDDPVYLHLLEPERRWLSLGEARVLRTASMRWVDEVPAGKNLERGPALTEEPLLLPLDLDGESEPDPLPDQPLGD